MRPRPRALPWAGMYRPFGAGRTRTTSISLRSIIFRELVANIIAHREYTSAAPATMMIYADRVEFKNPNVPHYHGRIDPGNFTPFPKNPTICKFMIQIGRCEELGSGVRKVNLYLPHYAPGAGRPVFEDGGGCPDSSPERAKHTSPGQRPGCSAETETAQALKGRDNS